MLIRQMEEIRKHRNEGVRNTKRKKKYIENEVRARTKEELKKRRVG